MEHVRPRAKMNLRSLMPVRPVHTAQREKKNCGMCTANFNYAFAILHCVYFVKSSNRQRLLIENPSFSFTWSTEFWEFGTDNVSRLSRFYSTDSCVPLSLSRSPPVTHCHEPSNKLQLSNKRQPFISIEQFTTRTLEPDGNISLELNAITNREKKRSISFGWNDLFFVCWLDM